MIFFLSLIWPSKQEQGVEIGFVIHTFAFIHHIIIPCSFFYHSHHFHYYHH